MVYEKKGYKPHYKDVKSSKGTRVPSKKEKYKNEGKLESFVAWAERVYGDSGLGKWYNKEKWVDISRKNSDGKHPACGDSANKGSRKKDSSKAYPKCRPSAEASRMSEKEKKKASEQKRRVERKDKDRKKGDKPNFVSHKKNKINESSKNVPNNPKLWSKAKSEAKKKFDVYPSAYANLFASKWYKSKGGTWKKKNESSLPTFKEWLKNKKNFES